MKQKSKANANNKIKIGKNRQEAIKRKRVITWRLYASIISRGLLAQSVQQPISTLARTRTNRTFDSCLGQVELIWLAFRPRPTRGDVPPGGGQRGADLPGRDTEVRGVRAVLHQPSGGLVARLNPRRGK